MNALSNIPLGYRFIAFGLLFVLLAFQAIYVGKHSKISTSCSFLAMFGLGFCLSAWLPLIAPSSSGWILFSFIRIVITTASLVALIEYGRRQAISTDGSQIGIQIYIPLALTVCAGALTGLISWEKSCLYILGIPGGILAALALWFAWKKHESKQILGLNTAVVMFVILALVGYSTTSAPSEASKPIKQSEIAQVVIVEDGSTPNDTAVNGEQSESVDIAIDPSILNQDTANNTRTLDQVMADRRRMSMNFLKTALIVLGCLIGIYQCRYIAMRAVKHKKAV